MNFRIIKTVFKKEVIETFRDKRTMIIMLVLPVILMPSMIIGIPALTLQREVEISELPSKIAVVGYNATSDIPDIATGLRISSLHYFLNSSDENLENLTAQIRELNESEEDIEDIIDFFENLHFYHVDTLDDAMELFDDGQVHAIVEIPFDLLDLEDRNEIVNITVYFDNTKTRSRFAYTRVNLIVSDLYTRSRQQEVLQERGLSQSEIEYVIMPSFTYPEDTSTPEERGGFILAMLLPMILGIYIVTGSMYHTIDTTAGEKERHTLEALLVTPPSKTELVMGKFLSILLVTMLIIIVAMLSLVISLHYSSEIFGGIGAVSFSMSLPVIIFLIVIFFVLAVLVNAVEMAICFFAKSFKEAENYITPIIFMVLIPAIFLQGLSPEDMTLSMFFVPILNVLTVFQEVLLGVVDPLHIGIVIGTSTLYAILASIIAIRIFNREEVLFRT
ncbi:MAG: ABC transporter permease [Thermoplasmata archaeon]|nr:MAG: ABC transporter permease [Thermoplasmata archaeon]